MTDDMIIKCSECGTPRMVQGYSRRAGIKAGTIPNLCRACTTRKQWEKQKQRWAEPPKPITPEPDRVLAQLRMLPLNERLSTIRTAIDMTFIDVGNIEEVKALDHAESVLRAVTNLVFDLKKGLDKEE